MDCSPPGFSVHGISQARKLDWVGISFSRGSSQPRNRNWVTCIAGRFFTSWATREALSSEKEAAKDATESPLTPTVMEQCQLISLVLPSSSWALEAQGRFGDGLWWETHFGVTVRITDQMRGQAQAQVLICFSVSFRKQAIRKPLW